MIEQAELEAVVEAALFATPDPISREKLLELFPNSDRERANEAIDRVLERYAGAPDRGIQAEEVAGGIRIVTRPELYGHLRRLFELSGRNRMSMAALETLAIIAYRQPITGPEIQELRSVNSSGVLKTLLERRLVRIAGRKMVVGKPFLYATTRDFLMTFGLRSLDDLPPLEEFEEMMGQLASGEEASVSDDLSASDDVPGPEPVASPDEIEDDRDSGGEEE